MSKLAHSDIPVVHIIILVDIEIRGNYTLAESSAQLSYRFTHDGHNLDLYSYCKLLTRMEKFTGKWYVLSTQVIYIRDAVFPVGNGPMTDFSDIAASGWKRPSYQFIYWHASSARTSPRTRSAREKMTQRASKSSMTRIVRGLHRL